MQTAVNKSDFIQELSSRCDKLDESIVNEAVHELLELMITTLQQDKRIEIRGFGSFCLHHQAPRLGRNPKTGKPVAVKAKAIPHFKPGKALKLSVNDSELYF